VGRKSILLEKKDSIRKYSGNSIKYVNIPTYSYLLGIIDIIQLAILENWHFLANM
jgi:hypothetical protein